MLSWRKGGFTDVKETPPVLGALLGNDGRRRFSKFWKYIKIFNSIFAFISIGAKIDNEISNKLGPYIFRITNQNHHRIGFLLPIEKERPKFVQLYIDNTEYKVHNRIRAFYSDDGSSKMDEEIVEGLIELFDIKNQIIRAFKMARDHFNESNFLSVHLRLLGRCQKHNLQYKAPLVSKIAGLIVGDLG